MNEIVNYKAIEIAKVEIDSQIATAKQFPRDEIKCIEKVARLATLDKATAEKCYYSLPRREKQKDGTYKDTVIEGESIRFAEIVMACWGNIRISNPIIEFGDGNVTATVQCADLETNTVAPGSCTRKFYNFEGSKELAIQNAVSTAIRTAVFRVVPKGYFKSVLDKIKHFSVADPTADVKAIAKKWFEYFKKQGITKEQVIEFLGLENDNLGPENFTTLTGVINAVKDGQAKLYDFFSKEKPQNIDPKDVIKFEENANT